jgi:hypothetical protein
MSGIGSVGSTPNLFAYLQSTSAENASAAPELGTESTRSGGMEARIYQALAAAGVDEETVAALKADLTAAFEESRASGSTPPDPQAMKSTVDAVFAEYGLDASEILGPPPGGGMHGAGPQGGCQPNSSDAAEENRQTLLELLNQMAEEGASSEELSQLLMDAVQGLDETA